MDSDKPIAAMRAASRRLQGLKLEEAEDPYGDSEEEESKEESRDTDTEQDSEQDSDQFSREQARALLKKLTKEMGSKKKAVKFASKYLGLHAYMCLEAAFSVNDRVAPNSADDRLQKTIVDTGCSIDMFHPYSTCNLDDAMIHRTTLYDVGATTTQCCDLLQGECKL